VKATILRDTEEVTKADLWKEIKRLRTGNAAPTGYASIVPVPKPIQTKNGDLNVSRTLFQLFSMLQTNWRVFQSVRKLRRYVVNNR
jgi:hypothetical protein